MNLITPEQLVQTPYRNYNNEFNWRPTIYRAQQMQVGDVWNINPVYYKDYHSKKSFGQALSAAMARSKIKVSVQQLKSGEVIVERMEDTYDIPRGRKSSKKWTAMLNTIAAMKESETWLVEKSDYEFYQGKTRFADRLQSRVIRLKMKIRIRKMPEGAFSITKLDYVEGQKNSRESRFDWAPIMEQIKLLQPKQVLAIQFSELPQTHERNLRTNIHNMAKRKAKRDIVVMMPDDKYVAIKLNTRSKKTKSNSSN